MSTYYEIEARGPAQMIGERRPAKRKGVVVRLGLSARKSFSGLRSFLVSGKVPDKLSALGVYDRDGTTEIVEHAATPHPYLRTSSGWWIGFTGRTERETKRNPGELIVMGPNPGGERLGLLHAIEYEHTTEGLRRHDFDGDEIIELLRDGSLRVYHPQGLKLWQDL